MRASSTIGTQPLVLERHGVRLAFDGATGAITELGDRPLGLAWNPQRAESWRLLVPLPERRGHYVRGAAQRLHAVERSDDALTLRWSQLESDAGVLDVDVALEARIADGEVRFRAHVENRSPYVIEELIAPCLAGITRPADGSGWRLVGPRVMSGAWEYRVFDVVPSSYHGPRKTNVLHPYPGGWLNEMSLGMPWVALAHDDGRCLSIVNEDDDVAYSCFMSEYDVEMRLDADGQAAFGNSAPQRWPEDPGAESTLALAWASFPFLAPGETFSGPEIVLRLHERGGWRAAVADFRTGFEQRFGQSPRRPTWLADADGWLVTCMLFNDGTIARPVADLPRLAEDAAAVGIGTLLVCGWDVGGLDRGYPEYRLDPRLGTEAEFAEALERCREHGVRVLLMAQLQQVCAETDWFREQGHRYLVRNPNGDPYYCGGVFYGSNTLLDQQGFTAPQILTANPAHPAFREHVLRELRRVVEYGADGVLIDKLHTGDPYSLDWNPELPGTPATRFHRALEETFREFAESVAGDPDFAIVTESGWDRAMPWSEASFTRYFERDHLPAQELAFPGVRLTTTIVGDGDTPMVNNALRHGHVVCLEPHYSHDDLASLPQLAPYLREALALRRALRPLLWHGRLADPAEVDVRGDGVLHGVFRPAADADDGQALAVVLNHFESGDREASVALPGAWASATVHRPFREPETVALPATLRVPAGEYVVVAVGDG